MSTATLVRDLKDADQDWEFYPSTDAMIRRVVSDFQDARHGSYLRNAKVLDVGAGDGRVLDAFHAATDYDKAECFAIEKAAIHIANMPKHVQMLGTDFRAQTLVDKEMDVVFSNPPYSEYEEWARRLIREVNARYLYLIIPQRWRDSVILQQIVKIRDMEVTSLGEFDFTDADRAARAKVEIVRFRIPVETQDNIDAFIEEMMPQLSVFDMPEAQPPLESETVRDMVAGGRDLVDVLVESHDADVAKLMRSFNSLGEVDPELLRSLEIQKHTVLNLIRGKIKATKARYWELLFDEMDTLRSRLASKQRKAFVNQINKRACVDFTHDNILAVLVWVSKWVNDYFDEQTIDLFRSLSTDSHCVRYKSNDRVWTKGDWRYRSMNTEDKERLGPYKLEFRMVVTHGGIECSDYDYRKKQFNGLTEYAHELLIDIIVAANNLHFDCDDTPRNYEWRSNKSNTLRLKDGSPLVEVKAFQKGTMHLRFNPAVMLALNIEAGRLLGWIRNPAEACDELEITTPAERDAVARSFGTAFRIGAPTALLDGKDQPHVAGLFIRKGEGCDVQLRVKTGAHTTDYRIDRWD